MKTDTLEGHSKRYPDAFLQEDIREIKRARGLGRNRISQRSFLMERDASFYVLLSVYNDSFISSRYMPDVPDRRRMYVPFCCGDLDTVGGIENLRQLMASLCDKSFADKTER